MEEKIRDLLAGMTRASQSDWDAAFEMLDPLAKEYPDVYYRFGLKMRNEIGVTDDACHAACETIKALANMSFENVLGMKAGCDYNGSYSNIRMRLDDRTRKALEGLSDDDRKRLSLAARHMLFLAGFGRRMENMSEIEEKIIGTVVRNGLAEGWTFSELHDDPQIERSSNFDEIMAACDAVDEIWLAAEKDGKYVGKMVFVLGNGEDVLSDCSAHLDKRLKEWINPIISEEQRQAPQKM